MAVSTRSPSTARRLARQVAQLFAGTSVTALAPRERRQRGLELRHVEVRPQRLADV
jgi:hypothetical protein